MPEGIESWLADGTALAVDGRRARGHASRQRIVRAMMALIAAGELAPSAARVAEQAGLGLRTVFRHFDDMDALYAEISATIAEQVLPMAMAPFEGRDWRAQMRELVERRAQIFETMLPFRLAANIKRYQSPFLTAQYGRFLAIERDLVVRLLPEQARRAHIAVEALCTALSFQTWRALRHDQNLSADAARAVVAHMVDALITTPELDR